MITVILTMYLVITTASCVILLAHWAAGRQQNIVFILADDLGWNDVGFHGSNQIPTPNIDALAYTGVILNNYFVTPVCTPSRAALMTGKYPIHTGLQHGVLHGSAPYGLSVTETLLPQQMQLFGYVTRAVGKWHLGSYKEELLPCSRGFDSHYGYWVGHQDYYDHTSQENLGYWGYDMRRGMNITWDDYGEYTTDLFTREAVQIIKNHGQKRPLFLYLAHLATHSANPYRPLQAPAETVDKFAYIEDPKRRIFAGMLSKLDDSVGAVVTALTEAGMLVNTLIVFSTDNGGPAAGFNSNAASNWPLRGVKDTLWEGGVRGAALVWSSLLPSGNVSSAMMHITDWFPTLLNVASKGSHVSPVNIDGVDVWSSLVEGRSSTRDEVLINIDKQRNIAGLRVGPWKLILGNTWNGTWDGWYGPTGRDYSYNWTSLYQSPTALALNRIRPLPDKDIVSKLRSSASVQCLYNSLSNSTSEETDTSVRLGDANLYLFNIEDDPCEQNNRAQSETFVLQQLLSRLVEYNRTVVPPRNKEPDPRSNPKYWGYAWVNWMDYIKEKI